ncbi:hypothetical protein HYH03_015058 [Edaphochlamys debaryana]|uniref:Methyltransferase domain-containing protein n=1 Tax=Edaphochlamys debaryana TaxID=47281 RepID=A0A835XNX3_9CHLO|nr:hypothetical protein HYH03_015058 [Edaphochlamys debaryana]|eukprot:KAG2486233.1 hypothetical protein HYH03_015058 [Edaphochlamys debaryana]
MRLRALSRLPLLFGLALPLLCSANPQNQAAADHAALSASWHAPHLPARVHLQPGQYGLEAVHNLSMWRSTLLSRVEQFMTDVGHSDHPGGHSRFDPFMPVVACPPGRPLHMVGNATPQDHDGGKWLCGLPQPRPGSEARPCIILSLGSNNNYVFEEAVMKESPCRVVTLDCTVDGRNLSDRHTFHKLCIGSQDTADKNPGLFVTYPQLTAKLGLESSPLLKIDVEGYEFPVLSAWTETTAGLPEQIAMEIHSSNAASDSSANPPRWHRPEFGVRDLALVFWHMANLGYAIISREDNVWDNGVAEYSFLRVEAPARFRLGPNAADPFRL